MTRDRILLVGEAPGRKGDPRVPLVGGRSGSFVQVDLCGMSLLRYVRTFETLNVLEHWPGREAKGDRFPMRSARPRAEAMIAGWKGRTAILLGRRVALAFGVREKLWFRFRTYWPGCEIAVVPHPSGVNRFWNDPANVDRGRFFFQSVVYLHGSTYVDRVDALAAMAKDEMAARGYA